MTLPFSIDANNHGNGSGGTKVVNTLHTILNWCAQNPLGGASFLFVGASISVVAYTVLHEYVLDKS